MNKFFKDYVRSSTKISDFVYQYEKVLNARYLKEKESDVKTKNSVPILKTSYKMEVEAAKVYTRKMFMKFQEELFCSKKIQGIQIRGVHGSGRVGFVPDPEPTRIYRVG